MRSTETTPMAARRSSQHFAPFVIRPGVCVRRVLLPGLQKFDQRAVFNGMAEHRRHWQTHFAADAERTARCSRSSELGSSHARPKILSSAELRADRRVLLVAILFCLPGRA